MTARAPAAWLRDRRPSEVAALAAGILVLGWLGWDLPLWDPRQQAVLHLIAAGAIGGLLLAALRGAELPRTKIDLPILLLLAAYAAATASAMNHGMSLRAMAAVLATTAMLPLALVAIRHRPSWVGVVASLPVLVLALPTLAYLVVRRLDWIVAGAPGLPPLRLLNEGTPFGSVAVPPFVIWPAWALAGLIESRGPRRWIRGGLAAVGIPLTILSGSRSAWLAIGATLIVAAVPWAWRARHRLRLPRTIGARHVLLSVALLAAAGIAAVVVLPRLTAVASLVYRANLWRDTLLAWATDPLLGIGPGFMPFARQAAAPDFSFPVRQPHSHNLPLGVLGDAGLVGLGAALLLVVAVALVAGPWRSRTATGRTAALVLLGLAIGGLFEDLSFLPNFNLLVIGLLAVALTDAGAVGWIRPREWSPVRRTAAGIGGAIVGISLLPAVVVNDVTAIAHRAGVEAAVTGHHAEARDHLVFATSLDRWHPAPPKALAVVADATGETEIARRAAVLAVELNPGDGASWTNLAVLCGGLDDPDCRAEAAARAAATASFLGRELANAAVAFEALDRPEAADDAYRRSLLSQRLTAFAIDWPRRVPIGAATLDEGFGVLFELNRVLAWWDAGESIEPGAVTDPAVRALVHAMRGERDAARPLLEEAIAARPHDPVPWQIAIVLRDHWGEPIDDELRAWEALTDRPFPDRDELPDLPARTDDIASFRVYPGDALVGGAERLETDPIWPWVLAETLP